MIITADLSEKEACYRLMQQLEPVPVGILINNAGFGDCGSFLETDADKEMQMIDVNVKAMHLLMKLMLRRMEKQEGGYILNVASSAGLLPAGPYMATYYATKAYMASLTRAVPATGFLFAQPVPDGILLPQAVLQMPYRFRSLHR